MRKRTFSDFSPEKFRRLNDDLDKLAEMIKHLSDDPKNQYIKPEIVNILQEMHQMAQKIGGRVADHVNDLRIDINLFIENPDNLSVIPKIFQDFQLLKNAIRSF